MKKLNESRVLSIMGQGKPFTQEQLEKSFSDYFEKIKPSELTSILFDLERKGIITQNRGSFIHPLK